MQLYHENWWVSAPMLGRLAPEPPPSAAYNISRRRIYFWPLAWARCSCSTTIFLCFRLEAGSREVFPDGGERGASPVDVEENNLLPVDSSAHRHLDQLTEDQSECGISDLQYMHSYSAQSCQCKTILRRNFSGNCQCRISLGWVRNFSSKFESSS